MKDKKEEKNQEEITEEEKKFVAVAAYRVTVKTISGEDVLRVVIRKAITERYLESVFKRVLSNIPASGLNTKNSHLANDLIIDGIAYDVFENNNVDFDSYVKEKVKTIYKQITEIICENINLEVEMDINERLNHLNKYQKQEYGFLYCEIIVVQGVKRIRYVFDDYIKANAFQLSMDTLQPNGFRYVMDKNDEKAVIEIDPV